MSKLNILIAIPYLDKKVLEFFKEIQPYTRFLLDSGAFTAWKKGKEVLLDDYCKVVENLPIKPWRYFTLDKIGDAHGTKENFATLIRRGFKPIPIFTRGENIEEIEYYYEHSDVLGIGGLVGTLGNKGFVKGILKKTGSRKVHLLGFTNSNYISYYKPYSCDSSTYSAALRYGTISLYCGNGRFIRLNKKDFITRPSQELINIFNLYHEDINRLSKESEWHNAGKGKNLLEMITYKSWTRYQLEVGLKFGTKYFLATNGFQYTKLIHDSYLFWLKHPSYIVKSGTPESLKASLRS